MSYGLISKYFCSFITVLKCTGAGDYDGGRYKPLEGPATLVVPPPRDCLHGVRNISSKLYRGITFVTILLSTLTWGRLRSSMAPYKLTLPHPDPLTVTSTFISMRNPSPKFLTSLSEYQRTLLTFAVLNNCIHIFRLFKITIFLTYNVYH